MNIYDLKMDTHKTTINVKEMGINKKKLFYFGDIFLIFLNFF